MKRTLVTIFAVAILGTLGIYAKGHSNKDGVISATPSSTNSTPTTQPSSSTPNSSSQYNNGTFVGTAADTPYGVVQIAAVISHGKIADIQFLQMPNDRDRSQQITNDSEPLLKQSALAKQNAQSIDFVSGATSTSYGYQESLQAALDKAANS
jgi:uncharacterized protein with FMN-binding domain